MLTLRVSEYFETWVFIKMGGLGGVEAVLRRFCDLSVTQCQESFTGNWTVWLVSHNTRVDARAQLTSKHRSVVSVGGEVLIKESYLDA